MTTPVGSPDWLKSVPGAAKAISTGNYSSPATNAAGIGTFAVQAYRALGIVWTPGQAQALFVDFRDDPHIVGPGIRRQFTAVNPSVARLTVPTLGAYVDITATRLDGLNNPTGTMTIIGTSATDRNAGTRGVLMLDSQANFTAGAGGTQIATFPGVGEGLASFYVRSTATAFSVFMETLDVTNSWDVLTEVNNTDPTPTRFQQHMPGQQGRIRFVNGDGVLRAVAYAVTIGD